MTTFSEELRKRLVSDWEGRTILRNGYLFEVPPINPGGATAQFVDLAVSLASELHEEMSA